MKSLNLTLSSILKLTFTTLMAVAFIGCNGFSSLSREQNANRFRVEMDKMLPELNMLAQADLSQTTPEERKNMKEFVSEYISMADYVIEVSAEDKISPQSVDNFVINRATAAQLLQRLESI